MPGASSLVTKYRTQRIPKSDDVLISGAAWDGDALVVSEDTLREHKLRRRNFSASVSNAMEGCHASWAAGQMMPNLIDPFLARDAGSFVHDIFEHMFTTAPEQRTKATYRAARDRFAADLFDDDATRQRWVDYLDTIALGLWELEDPAEVDVFATELSIFGLPITDAAVPIVGFLDRVSILGREGGFVIPSIDDYKTGKWSSQQKLRRYGDHYGDQLRSYALALRTIVRHRDEAWFKEQYAKERDRWMWEIADPVQANLLYTMVGRSRSVDLSPDALEQTAAKLSENWATHNRLADTRSYDTTTGPLCGWCPLVAVCPAAAAEGRVASDRAPGLPSARQIDLPLLSACGITRGGVPAHRGTESERKPTMTEQTTAEPQAKPAPPTRHLSEGKPWDEMLNDDLNIGSYAAQGAFAILNRATAALKQAYPGQSIKKAQIETLAVLLAKIVRAGERHVTGRFSWQSSANTRVRGLLFTVMESTPLPVGGDADGWRAWAKKVRKNVIVLIDESLWLWDRGDTLPDTDFSVFEALPQPGPFDTQLGNAA
ncbi:RecB family exonuclease [Pseudoclavibacter sp. CFCC 13796]|uniref:RecB family exonuclease n=1 Tax=Pseudoclavibacter sp. CFCC 13796 TaxID=2615179 RepID=UPI001787B5E2|nr:PD-(D/E)XK nuclease family protein [Pseudoclavibacter sp. CFCC 13796]